MFVDTCILVKQREEPNIEDGGQEDPRQYRLEGAGQYKILILPTQNSDKVSCTHRGYSEACTEDCEE